MLENLGIVTLFVAIKEIAQTNLMKQYIETLTMSYLKLRSLKYHLFY